MGKIYPDLGSVKKVLVVKLRHLGDVLLASPVFSNIKSMLPHAEIDAYIWKEAEPVLQGNPAISNIHLYDRKWKKTSRWKRIKKELALLRQIRKKKYDLIINLTEGDRGAIVSWISGAAIKVGFDPGKSGFFHKRDIFTHLVKQCPSPRHRVERDLDVLRRIGIFPKEEKRKLFFHIPETTLLQTKSLLQKYQLIEGEYALIHPASRWRFKCLPPQLIAKVIDRLEEKVVLTGGPGEEDLLDDIVRFTNKDVVHLGGKTNIKELGALMQMSKGLITVDSLSLHMASALKVPVVALFGPTSEQNWGPWQHPHSIVVSKNISCRPCRLDGCGGSKMSDCLWTLSVDAIIDAWNHVSAVCIPMGSN